MFTNLMRRWLQQIRRSQFIGKPHRRRQRLSYGRSESLESRTVLTAVISTIGSTALVSTADNSAATARDLGTLAATPTTVSDFVGSADTQDYSRFTIARTSDFTLRLSGLTSDADVQLQNAQGQFVASSTRGGNSSEDISRVLDAGTYYVRVYQYSGDTNYDLTLSAVTSAVANDNSTAGARELGAIGVTPTTVTDFVGSADTQDYSRFTIARTSDFTLRLSGLTSDADVQLQNAQGQFVASSTRGGNLSEDISRVLDAGTYYVRVFQYSGDTNYDLTLSAVTSAVANDNSTAVARDLGTIGATLTTVSDFVGNSDTQDYFRFTIAQSSDIHMQLSGLQAVTDLTLVDSQGQSIASSNTYGINKPLEAGTYFARVALLAGDTNYVLSVSADVNDNTTATARDIGTLSGTTTTVSGSVVSANPQAVSLADPQDYCRFTVAQSSDVSLRLSGLTWNADLQLLNAQGSVLVNSAQDGSASEDIHRTLAAGTYFVRISSQCSNATNYDLTLFALSVAPSDDSQATARDLGAISTATTTVRDFVGSADSQDYSRFTIARTSDVTLRLNGLTSDANLELLDSQGRFVASSTRWRSLADEILTSLDVGTYYVRVYQYSGDTNYTLTLSAVMNDNSIANARDIGAIGSTPTIVSDVIGNSDTQDYYRFTISQPGAVTLRSSVTTAASFLELFDGQGRSITDSTGWGFGPGEIRWTLDVGTYFVRVRQGNSSADIRYDLTLSVAASDNFLATARDLGALGTTPLTVHDFVGSTDTQDYFRFNVPQTRNVSIRQVGASYGADIELLNASGQVVANSTLAGTMTNGIDRELSAGTYFVRAFQQYGEVNYDLSVSVPITSVANDNSIATARDLGSLSSTPMTVRDFVGGSDTQDYFRFTLTQTSNVRLQLSGLSADADLQLFDAQGRVVGNSCRWGTLPEEITRTLSAGTYFVRVVQWSGNTNYNLTLSL